jgi:hypothetical protein
MNRKPFRVLWMIILLAASALACNLFSQVTSQIDEAQAVATRMGDGKELLATFEAVMTDEGSRLLSTAVTVITEQGPQYLDTAQAFATQEGPGLIETAQAFATQKGPALQDTVQAFATEQGPELVETAQALATQIAADTPLIPADIPLVEGERANLAAILGMIAYSTPMPYDEVLAFYLAEMPANGWELSNEGTYQIPNTAVLNYTKIDRKAIVSLSAVDQRTYILILIQDK